MSSLIAGKLPNLQLRLVSVPWLKRTAVSIRCFSFKADDPVRYKPKKLRDVNQNQCCSPAPPIHHHHSNDAHGVSLGKRDVETKCLRPLPKVVQELQISNNGAEALEKDVKEMQLSNDKQERSETCRTKQGAKKVAIQLLARRAYTVVELRKKLTAKMFPDKVVEAILRDFQDRGLISDHLYAEMYSAIKWKSSSWGPRRIKQELLKKGISEGDVEKAVKLTFEDKSCDERSSMSLSDSSLQQLYVQASKQWKRSQNVPHETRKARVVRWLQYRGFDWGVVSSILKKLESECLP